MTEDSPDPDDTPDDVSPTEARNATEDEESPPIEEAAEESAEPEAAGAKGDQPEDDTEETSEGENGGRSLSLRGRSPREYLLWGAFGLSLFLAVVSALSLYLQIGSIIGIWVESRFQPLVRAGFDLAILLLASYTALAFAKRLRDRE